MSEEMDKNIYYDDTYTHEAANKKREFGNFQAQNLTIGNQSKMQTMIKTIKNILLIVALITFIMTSFLQLPDLIKPNLKSINDSNSIKDFVTEKSPVIHETTEEDSVIDMEEAEHVDTQPWKHLHCQKGHKYLFSNLSVTWETAVAQCKLYGGWLLEINNQAEQNCLLKYGWTLGSNAWFWTDAKIDPSSGLFVHAKTNKELTWFAPKRTCSSDGNFRTHSGGQTIILAIYGNGNNHLHGAWCDSYGKNNQKTRFICESII